MFRFEHSEFLWSFAIIPLLLVLYFLSRWLARRAQRKLATDSAMVRLLSQWSESKHTIRTVFLFVGIALLCMALANPQWGLRREKVEATSADIFIALDISNSMYAQDIVPSRMERAKKFATDLVTALRGERIGLILFAGYAYLQMPLTTDYAASQVFIRSAHPGLASTQGTSVGDAIELAMNAFLEDEDHHKALVIITDGENHEDGAIEAMERASNEGMIPFVIAVGTPEGAPIPIVVQGREDYKRDEHGNPVRTQVNEEFLNELAEAGNGSMYRINDGGIIGDIKSHIDKFDKRAMAEKAFKDFESYYQYFLFGGIFLIALSWVIGELKSGRKPVLIRS